MEVNLRDQYLAFLAEHDLAPRTIPTNAEYLRRTLLDQMLRDARASGDELDKIWADDNEEALRKIQDQDSTIHPAEMLIMEAVKSIERTIHNTEKYRQRFRANVFAGEFPTGSINAQAVQVEGGFLVLINSGTMTMIQQVVNFLIQGNPDRPSNVEPNVPVIDGIVKVLAAYLRYGDPFFGPKPISSGMISVLTYGFFSACAKFVLAHEYGHILAGHFEDANLQLENLNTEAGTIDVIKKSWQQELEADTIGYKIVLGIEEYSQIDVSVLDQAYQEGASLAVITQAMNSKCAIAAPFLFLTIDVILERVKEIIADRFGRITPASLHPPAKTRIGNILPVITRLDPRYTGFINFPGILARSFETVCEKIMAEIMKYE